VAGISGLLVTCWTVARSRSTTAPPRGIIPKLGGVSVSSAPRPCLPLSRRRRPWRPWLRPHPACPGGPPPGSPRHLLPGFVRGAAASWKQGLGAPARSSAAPLRDGDRVLGPLAAAPRCVPGQTGTVSTPAGVDADSHSWCQSRRRSGAHRTGTGHAAAQVESRRALVGSSPHGHRWDNGHRLAHAGLGRSQRRWRRRDAMAWVSWRPSCLGGQRAPATRGSRALLR
jgi:hypothetical protein